MYKVFSLVRSFSQYSQNVPKIFSKFYLQFSQNLIYSFHKICKKFHKCFLTTFLHFFLCSEINHSYFEKQKFWEKNNLLRELPCRGERYTTKHDFPSHFLKNFFKLLTFHFHYLLEIFMKVSLQVPINFHKIVPKCLQILSKKFVPFFINILLKY